MKISELPQEIKEKALEYQRNTGERFKKDTDNLDFAFSWEGTEEGFSYWYSLFLAKPTQPDIKQQLIDLRKQFPNDMTFGAEVAKLLNQ